MMDSVYDAPLVRSLSTASLESALPPPLQLKKRVYFLLVILVITTLAQMVVCCIYTEISGHTKPNDARLIRLWIR